MYWKMTLDLFQSDDDRKVLRSNVGNAKILGTVLVLVGIVGIVMLTKVDDLVPYIKTVLGKESHSVIDQYGYIILMIVSVSIVFSFLKSGLIYLLAMRKLTIDRKQKNIVLVERKIWTKTQVHSIDDFDKVMLEKKIVSDGDSSITYYPVKLTKEHENLWIEEQEKDYLKARFIAYNLAEFLHMPVMDCSTETSILREPEYLRENLLERLKRTGEKRDISPVADSKITQQTMSRKLILTLPFATSRFFGILIFILVAFFALPILGFLTSLGSVEDLLVAIPGLLLFLVIIRGCFWFWHVGRFEEQIHVSPNTLEIHLPEKFIPFACGRSQKRIEIMPVKEIKELILAEESIVVISDKIFVDFAGTISTEERQWLVAMIENTISN